jgi:serine/threonine protein kinase
MSMSSTAIHRNALSAGTSLLEYRLEAVLGVGGFGMTYLARDINLDKPVAIKEYFPSSVAMRALDGSVVSSDSTATHDYQWGLERFLQEARTLARFSHPHIVRVNRYFEANSTGYMVMDYEDGESLQQVLKKDPAPTDARLKDILLPLLDGLQAVHMAGFLHRDIKPANIFIRRNGSPVLIDFGSARQAMGDSTKTLTAVLTPGYAPLEQYSGAGEQGPWTDIYALGGVLYRIYTGENPPDAVSRIRNDVVPEKLITLRGRASPAMLGAMEWALTLDEQSRPRTVEAWRKTLEGKMPAPATTRTRGAPALTATAAPVVSATAGAATRPMAQAAVASASATRREPAPARATVRVNYAGDEDEGASKWRWIAIGTVLLFLAGLGYTAYSRKAARAAAEKEEARKLAEQKAEEARQAQLALMREQALRRQPPSAPADSSKPAPDTSALDQREAALREKEARAAEREAALKKLEEERARAVQAQAQTPAKPAPAETPRPTKAELPATPSAPPAAPTLPVAGAPAMDPIDQRIAADFRANDSNGDGYLTLDEIRGKMPGLERDFARVDTNGDGRVSLEELLARRPFRGPPPEGGAPGGPGGPPPGGAFGGPGAFPGPKGGKGK